MNEQKVAFVFCYNDESLLNESIFYINSLEVPKGYEIEIIPIENATSMTSGYNFAMQQTDAKYKVYLHQDVFIINPNFLYEILDIFSENKQIGLLGVVGAKVLPTDGIWWDAHQKYGKVYESHTGKMDLLNFVDVENKYESVQAIDGLIMVTQYDIPWREDIFDGWHFYDISQSAEFLKNGYLVVIPNQVEPWCIHDCGIVNVKNRFERYRKTFLDEYSEFLFPLVSILIPTYNRPLLLKEALNSVLDQTYQNIEIIICDDSTNDSTQTMLAPILKEHKNIRFYKNEERLGKGTGLENGQRCLEFSNGEIVGFLMDDDKFSPEKISKMVNYFIQYEGITLVTSYRQVINLEGEIMQPISATKRLFEQDTLISGRDFGKFVLSNMLNVIGEPTTPLFRKTDLNGKFGEYRGKQYNPLGDISTWLQLLQKGDAVYIAEPLSYFRLHNGQNANDIQNMIRGAIEWFHLIKDSYVETNFVDDVLNLHEMLIVWLQNNNDLIKKVSRQIYMSGLLEKDEYKLRELNICYQECIDIIFKNFDIKKL